MIEHLPNASSTTDMLIEKCRTSIMIFRGILFRFLFFSRTIMGMREVNVLKKMPRAPRGWLNEEISAPKSQRMIQNRFIVSINIEMTVEDREFCLSK